MRIISKKHREKKGFTVIELIVVVVIIAILATISIVGYSAWRKSTISAQVKSDLNAVASAMESARTFNNGYPATLPTTVNPSNGVNLAVQSATSTQYCVDGSSASDSSVVYYIASETKDQGARLGTCAVDRAITTAPALPTNLTVTLASSTQVGLSWNAASGATSYLLECASDAAFVVGFRQTTVTATSGSVTGLQAVNTYYCRIKAVNSVGTSAYTATVSTNTTTLQPPSGFASSSVNNVSITFTWNANPDATSYNVECATDNGFTTGLIQSPSTATTVTVTGLTPYTTYYCHVRTISTISTSPYSSTVTTATTANFGTIAAATGLTEVSPGPASGGFSWTGITCSLGSPQYRLVWVSPQTSATAWASATTLSGITYPQQTVNTWKVESKCTYSGLDSSVTPSSNKSFTSVGTADPVGAFGAIGWNDRWQFNVNANTYTCTSPATLQFQLVATLIDYTSGSWTYGWTISLTSSVNNANQGARMTTNFQVRCLLNSINSNVISSGSRTDNASVDAPGSVPGWCVGTCGNPRGDRWGAVGCPAGTYAVYWSYLVGDYSNPYWGAYEAANFLGYDRGYISSNVWLNDYLMARCTSDFRTSGWGPQGYVRY